jgi:cytosine/adenosine deaminase-related metal-dependent hydrolase
MAGTLICWKPRWIALPDRGLVEGHAVVTLDGRLQGVTPLRQLPAGGVSVEFTDAILLPMPVNAHVHLDLSAFETPIPAGGHLTDWLRRVVAHRRGLSVLPSDAFARGARLLSEAHTLLVGDILASPGIDDVTSAAGLHGTLFREVIGLKPERFEPLYRWMSGAGPTGTLSAGFSPHAPYSTARAVYARAGAMPFQVTHWFESSDEREFLSSGRGPFRDFLEQIGAWPDEPDAGPGGIDDPWSQLLGDGSWVLIHANYLTPDDREHLASTAGRRQVRSVVYCPRTHHHFGHPRHPADELLRRGIPVALGTDSLASNPDLNVWREGIFLAGRETGLSPLDLLRMLTVHGATAVGLKIRNDLTDLGEFPFWWVLRPPQARAANPWEGLFDPKAELLGWMCQGQWASVDGV